MVDFTRPRNPVKTGSGGGRLGLLTALLLAVILVMWLAPRFIGQPGTPPPSSQPSSRPAGSASVTRPASRPASMPALPENQRLLLADVRDDTHGFDSGVVATLHSWAEQATVLPLSDPRLLDARYRGRRVSLVGKPMKVSVIQADSEDSSRDLLCVRMQSRKTKAPFAVWVSRKIYETDVKLVKTALFRVTGLYFKRWRTHEGIVLDTHTGKGLPPEVVPVIIASPRGLRRILPSTGRAGMGLLGLSHQAWVLVIAVIVIFGYVALRILFAMKGRRRREAKGGIARGLSRIAPHLSQPAPQREPASEKKIAAARNALELAEQVDGVPTIPVTTPGRNYQVHVVPGLLKQTGDILAKLFGKPRNTALVTDENVGRLYAETVRESLESAGFTVAMLTVPAGEASKDIAEAAKLYGPMLAADMDRDALLVALGGGMVGDLGGFVAATYMRGIDFVQVPTSLLAQVDASVGGKVAVNLAEGKNLVGAFHQPCAVIADVSVLSSLPDDQYASGLAEVVKHGVIRDEGLFVRLSDQRDRILARDEAVMAEVVAANCRIKAEVVSADEKESGVRAILNYGHTVGHALEILGHYKLSHGAAVSLGMIAASHIAMARGLIGDGQIERQRELLEAFGLPVTLKEIDAEAVLRTMRHDKKVRDGKIRFVLPTRIGHVEIYDDVSDAHIRTALAAISG